MYLFTRSRRLAPGQFVGAMDWIAAATQSVRKNTGRETNAWAAVLSPELGVVTWSIWAETQAEIIEAGDKLAASSSWLDLLERGGDYFEGPVQDGLATVLAGTVEPGADPPEYVGVATAVAAPGRLSDAVSFGIELAEHAKALTGQDAVFLLNATGLYGGVSWLIPSADIAAVDAWQAAVMADPEWLPLIDRIGPAYSPGAAQSLFRRIA
jgi:hypothetical protein